MHIALDFSISQTFLEISRTCNIPNPQLVKSFLQEHSFLFHMQRSDDGEEVLVYSAPFQLRSFFLDPGRSRHLYSMPWIIDKCWEAVKYALQVQIPLTHNSIGFFFGLQNFFAPNQDRQVSGASLMLFAESIRGELDNDNLLRFLGFLCRMPWHTCFNSEESEACTLAIAQWVCEGLVS
jgi:hypothetical protein